MLESRPSPSPGTLFGYALIAGLVLIDVGLFSWLINQPVTILSFVWGVILLASLPVMIVVAYGTASLAAASYHVVGGALLIQWGRIRQVIALADIRRLVPGASLAAVKRFRGLRWPGFFWGQGRVCGRAGESDDPIEYNAIFYASRPLPQQLVLVTDTAAYAVSPVDLQNFTDCLEALRLAELTGDEEAPLSDLGPLNWRIWRDRLAQVLLILAVGFNGLLFAFLTAVYGRLPAQVPLHFSRLGDVDRMGAPGNLFILPLIGLFTWLVNGILGYLFYQGRQRVPALLLWAAAAVVQIAGGVALFELLAKI